MLEFIASRLSDLKGSEKLLGDGHLDFGRVRRVIWSQLFFHSMSEEQKDGINIMGFFCIKHRVEFPCHLLEAHYWLSKVFHLSLKCQSEYGSHQLSQLSLSHTRFAWSK